MCSVSFHVNRNKCGQTSRPVVRAAIQTSCNFEENICNCNCLLDCLYYCFHNVLLEFRFNVMVWQDNYTTLSSNFNLLLHKDFLYASSSSKSNTKQCSRTTETHNSIEYCTIQKGSVQCTVAAVDISCLLSSVSHYSSLQME